LQSVGLRLAFLAAVLGSGCGRSPTDAACIPGTYNSTRWPPSYWVQTLPEREETLAHVPPGVFMLVRSSKAVEAIRFTDVMAAPSEGDQCGCADYEVYRLSNGGKPQPRLTSSGRVSEFRVRGVHPFGYQPGHYRLDAATGSIGYEYPTQIAVRGTGLEVAVSAWTSIADVDPTSHKLKWFRYTQNGTRTVEAVNFSRNELP
jgi:hypothetical protein